MNRSQDIKCFVLTGGGILLVAPDGRTETAYSPQIADGASADGVRAHFEWLLTSLDGAVKRLSEPAIDLARESTSSVPAAGTDAPGGP